MMRKYNQYLVVGYSYDPLHYNDNDDLWETIDDPAIHWLKRQDQNKFSVQLVTGYRSETAKPYHTEVYVAFSDDKLELEYLLRFS